VSEEQRRYAEHVRGFAEDVLSVSAEARLAEGRFDRAVWHEAAEFGLAGLPVPEQWGGSGLRALDTMLAIEALGEGCADMGLVFSLCAHMFACAVPIWRHGSDDICDHYLLKVTSGRLIAANAITEPESGSDAYALRTHAQRDGRRYVLNGQKCFITNAPVADLFLVYAATDPSQSYFGISAFLVEADNPGLKVVPEGSKTGLVTSPWGSLYLDDCIVDESSRLGPEGAGASIFHDSMTWERACLFAAYVGYMQRVLAKCIHYAQSRRQYQRPIGHNQSVSNRLVDYKLRLEAGRLLLYRAGWLYDQGEPYEEAVAQSKLWISESAVQGGLDAIQLFGGGGVLREAGVDRLLLDSLPARIFSGTSEIQREVLARHMGLRSHSPLAG